MKVKKMCKQLMLIGGLVIGSFSMSFAGNPYVLGWFDCPSGCAEISYMKCWHSCFDCDCDASSQTTCGCSEQ